MEYFVLTALSTLLSSRWRRLSEGSFAHTEIYNSNDADPDLVQFTRSMLQDLDYVPPPYCVFEYHGQLQTATQFTVRNVSRLLKSVIFHEYLIRYDRELLRLNDGGTVALDWAYKYMDISANLDQSAPVIILHHGLVGDSQSEYLFHMAWDLLSAGYRVVVLVARGCGGLELTNGELFAGRRTNDIAACIDRVSNLFPRAKIFLVGFSLGAALSLQYLSYDHNDFRSQNEANISINGTRSPITAAICVSPPWDITQNSFRSSWIASIWSVMIALPLKLHYLSHHQYLQRVNPEVFGSITMAKVLSCMSMADFDELMYRTHYHPDGSSYTSLKEYYDDISPVHGAHLIHTPTMVLTAKDDPLCMHEHAPSDPNKLGKGLIVVKTPYGGHLAYPEGLFPWTSSWTDRIVIQWFNRFR